MAKKKHHLSKKRKQKLLQTAVPFVVIVCSLIVGAAVTKAVSRYHQKPLDNLVWAADNSVTIPPSLIKYLQGQDSCEHYKGANSAKGIGLWGVYQISRGKFAKIAYGCSWNLTSYIMAVKQDKGWTLVPPAEYFAAFKDSPQTGNGALPNCTQLNTYKIDKIIEPFCILPDGMAQVNQQN